MTWENADQPVVEIASSEDDASSTEEREGSDDSSSSSDDSSHGCIRPSQDAASSAPPSRHVVGVDASSSRFRHHAGVRGLGEGLVAVGIESADTTSDGFCITTLMLHRNGYQTELKIQNAIEIEKEKEIFNIKNACIKKL